MKPIVFEQPYQEGYWRYRIIGEYEIEVSSTYQITHCGKVNFNVPKWLLEHEMAGCCKRVDKTLEDIKVELL